jgi:hypothetical protein
MSFITTSWSARASARSLPSPVATFVMFAIRSRDATSEATLVRIASRQITMMPVINLR